MNVLQWHIIDGQSFPLESEKFPTLAEKGRYCKSCTYSPTQIKAFVEYARDRGVRVIPELCVSMSFLCIHLSPAQGPSLQRKLRT